MFNLNQELFWSYKNYNSLILYSHVVLKIEVILDHLICNRDFTIYHYAQKLLFNKWCWNNWKFTCDQKEISDIRNKRTQEKDNFENKISDTERDRHEKFSLSAYWF